MRRGKVRDIYDLGSELLLVSTDRISAFDWVLPTGIPDKGRVLTQISAFWFDRLGEPNHVISSDVGAIDLPAGVDREPLVGRSMLVRKTKVVPIECVVRGYLSGSGWKEYRKQGTVCGIRLPAGLQESDQLPEPIFTPATKAESGHDINISFETMVQLVGREVSQELRRRSLDVYRRGAEYARSRGIIIADTKFEWGRVGDEIILIDEVLTPDSSRFWPADQLRARAARSRRSTSSSSATGWRRPAGTRTARRRDCPPTWWPRRGPSTSRPTNQMSGSSPAAGGRPPNPLPLWMTTRNP